MAVHLIDYSEYRTAINAMINANQQVANFFYGLSDATMLDLPEEDLESVRKLLHAIEDAASAVGELSLASKREVDRRMASFKAGKQTP